MDDIRIRRLLATVARPVAALVAVAAFAALPACETVKGIGQDIQNVGEAGQEAISDDD